MTYDDIIEQVSKEIELSPKVVDKTYKSYWKSIRDIIQELPLKENLSEEEFNKYKTNFNIPSLGKLSCTYNRAQKILKRFEYIKRLKDK